MATKNVPPYLRFLLMTAKSDWYAILTSILFPMAPNIN